MKNRLWYIRKRHWNLELIVSQKKSKKSKKSVDKQVLNWYSGRALTLIVSVKYIKEKKSIKKLKKVLTK